MSVLAAAARVRSRRAARPLVAAALAASLSLLASCEEELHPREPPRPTEGPARVDDNGRIRLSLAELGLADAQHFNSQPTLTFPFFSRSDQVLVAASLTLQFADLIDPAWGVRGLEVLVNQEKMARLEGEQLRGARREAIVAIDPKALGDKNQLTLRLLVEHEEPCGTIAPESWRLLKAGMLTLEAAPLPLPNELSQLPLPFVDRAFDREAQIHLVLPAQPTRAQIQLAGLIASWFGLDAGAEARFMVSEGELPEQSAVVLLDGKESAHRLGLPEPTTASLELVDHPRHTGSNVKLLLLSGRDENELARAVENLVAGSPGRFQGARAQFEETPEVRRWGPYESPRWLPAGHDVQLAQVAAPEQLAHEGKAGGKIAVRFRIAPDIFVWPDEFVELDLGYTVGVPPGSPPPRLDVQLNGVFLGTLAPPDSRLGELSRRATLRVHRTALHAFNELVVFVNYSQAQLICPGGEPGEYRVQLLGDSTLKLGRYGHFADLPDLGLFAHDGFPFTRLPDLAETTVVLSDLPRPEEIGMLLSTLAHLGTVTGVVARPELRSSAELAGAAPLRDLLLIGMPETLPLLQQWSDRVALVLGGGPARLQHPRALHLLLDLFAGQRGRSELERATAMAAGASRYAAVAGFESPLTPGRTVVAITGSSEEDWPGFAAFTGYAQSRREGGDLLLFVSGQRGLFRIGESFGSGTLRPLDRLRWFLAGHVLLLVPCLFLGVIGLALLLNLGLRRQAEFRLSLGEAEESPSLDENAFPVPGAVQ